MSRDKSNGRSSSRWVDDEHRSSKSDYYYDDEYSSCSREKRKYDDEYHGESEKYEDRRSHRSGRSHRHHDDRQRSHYVSSRNGDDEWDHESEKDYEQRNRYELEESRYETEKNRHREEKRGREKSRYESEKSRHSDRYESDRGRLDSRYDDDRRRHRERRDDCEEYESRRYSRRDHNPSCSRSRSKSRSYHHESSARSSKKHRRSRSRSRSRSKSYQSKQDDAQSGPSNKAATNESSHNEQYYQSHHIFNSTSMYIPSLPDAGDDHQSSNDSTEADEIFDKEKIHKEMQERLRQHLAKEGKVYPPPKPKHEASHPIFANDGSFLETFKKMQEQQQQQQVENERAEALRLSQPLFGKRRGGKVLKTGVVQKPRVDELNPNGELGAKDPWAMYLREVQKYKNASGDADAKTRPLVK